MKKENFINLRIKRLIQQIKGKLESINKVRDNYFTIDDYKVKAVSQNYDDKDLYKIFDDYLLIYTVRIELRLGNEINELKVFIKFKSDIDSINELSVLKREELYNSLKLKYEYNMYNGKQKVTEKILSPKIHREIEIFIETYL